MRFNRHLSNSSFIILLLLSILFSGCSSKNMNIDEPEGLANIKEKIIELIGEDSQIISLKLFSEIENSELKSFELVYYEPGKKAGIEVKYDLDDDALKKDTIYRYKSEPELNNPDLSDFVEYIEQSKSFIPEGYQYQSTKSIYFGKSYTTTFTIRLDITDENKVNKNKLVRREYYTRYEYTYNGRGRINGQKPVKEYYYTMSFKVTPKGLVPY